MGKSPIIKVVKIVSPAVVRIASKKNIGGNNNSEENQTPLYPKQKGSYQINGGSGFLVSKDGLILTNRHVASDNAGEYEIITSDDKKYSGKLIARDEINDVSILKINGKDLPVIKLGDSSSLELGQQVVAFGNALGVFKNTVSAGIISGLFRLITAQTPNSTTEEKMRGLIQTDAAINPGNSGGPLCDTNGKAIGINTAMILGAENIGFAIPINTAKRDLDDLKKYGRIRQPFLGVRYLLIDKEIQKKFGLPVNYGALVMRELPDYIAIMPGSTAAKAGLKEKDIILECNGEKINEDKSVTDAIHECRVGKEISLKILRNGKELTIKTTLQEK